MWMVKNIARTFLSQMYMVEGACLTVEAPAINFDRLVLSEVVTV